MTQTTTLVSELLAFKSEIESLIADGFTLDQIRNWSYKQRESGRNVPYLAVGTTGVYIIASPTSKQKELKAFFDQPAPGCNVLPKYVFFVEKIDGKLSVVFNERLSRTKNDDTPVTA